MMHSGGAAVQLLAGLPDRFSSMMIVQLELSQNKFCLGIVCGDLLLWLPCMFGNATGCLSKGLRTCLPGIEVDHDLFIKCQVG